DRPSNPPMPRATAIMASCAASSASSELPMTRRHNAWIRSVCRSSSWVSARRSPAAARPARSSSSPNLHLGHLQTLVAGQLREPQEHVLSPYAVQRERLAGAEVGAARSNRAPVGELGPRFVGDVDG